MPDQKFTLEDILTEYSPDSDDNSPHVDRVKAQKVINSTMSDPTKLSPPTPTSPRPASHERKELFDNAERNPEPANEFPPTDLSRKKVAVVNSEGISNIQSEPQPPAASPESASVGDIPMIRPMTDSTRAKEAQKQKKKKNKKGKRIKTDQTYEKETPNGEYMFSPAPIKKKKRTRSAIISEAESPEGRKLITDIVPSPAAVEAAKPVQPAPRAEVTSIDLSQKQEVTESDLDVHITQDTEEFTEAKTKEKRTKRIVDFNYYGDVEDVGRDIYELKYIITSRVVILALTAFLSIYITVFNQFGLPILDFLTTKHIAVYLLVHLALGAIAVFSSLPVITKGFKNLFTFKADGDSMTSITAIACILALITAFFRMDMAKAETIHIYMPVGILSLLFNAIGKLLIIRRADRNFKFISKEFDRHGVVYVRDEERAERLTRGTLGDFPILAAMKKTDFLTDFLRYSYSSDITDSYCRKAAPLCLIFSLVITLFLTFFRMGTLASIDAVTFGFSIFSMLICASSCIGLPFCVNIPLENISEITLKNKGILLGYQSVDDLYDANSVLLGAETLFPEGTVKMEGIKVFSNTKLDEALLEAASLAHHAGSIMYQIFGEMIVPGKENVLYDIENYSYEENTGLCGWINNKRVLFGSRELMENHNIEGVPSRHQEAEYLEEGTVPMYLSISGNIAAMFSIKLSANNRVKEWANKLCKKKVFLILKSVDPCITPDKIAEIFGIPADMVRVIPKKLHEDFDEETKKTIRLSASIACTGRFSSMAQLLLGIKVVHSAATIGLIVQTVSILLGLGLCMMLILSKAFEFNYFYMTAAAMTIYNLACTGLTYLAVNLKKLK